MLRVKINLNPVVTICCLLLVVVSVKLLEHGFYVFGMLGFALSLMFLIAGSCEIRGERMV
jgi:hypothetical protein